jgi:hypothetical protein
MWRLIPRGLEPLGRQRLETELEVGSGWLRSSARIHQAQHQPRWTEPCIPNYRSPARFQFLCSSSFLSLCLSNTSVRAKSFKEHYLLGNPKPSSSKVGNSLRSLSCSCFSTLRVYNFKVVLLPTRSHHLNLFHLNILILQTLTLTL